MTKKKLAELAKAAAAEYQRNWNATHKKNRKKINQTYWQNKVLKAATTAAAEKERVKQEKQNSEESGAGEVKH